MDFLNDKIFLLLWIYWRNLEFNMLKYCFVLVRNLENKIYKDKVNIIRYDNIGNFNCYNFSFLVLYLGVNGLNFVNIMFSFKD